MKYFLLLLLFSTSFIDLQAQKRQNARRAPASSSRPAKPKILIAKKQRKEPLLLLSSNFRTWEMYLSYPETGQIQYSAIYYNTNTKKSYFANMVVAKNVQYTLDPEDNREALVEPSIIETSLLYVGNLRPNQRVMLNTNRQQTYIKTLTEIKDDVYLDNGDIICSNSLPAYPILNNLYEIQYTNQNKQVFNRVLSSKGTLRLLGVTFDNLVIVPIPTLTKPKPKPTSKIPRSRQRPK
ncbi:MAG: hypothetical protein KFW21_00400 [Spirochaetota bacterium]|nr:hypothetical protein [Spirochaetota bacterium]